MRILSLKFIGQDRLDVLNSERSYELFVLKQEETVSGLIVGKLSYSGAAVSTL